MHKNKITKIDKTWTLNEQNVSVEKNGFGWMNEIVCKFTISKTELLAENFPIEIPTKDLKTILAASKSVNESDLRSFEYSLCNILNHIKRYARSNDNFSKNKFSCPVIKNYLSHIMKSYPSFNYITL